MSLSPAASTVLASLRSNAESTTTEGGAEWGSVYLPNVGRGHSFAGHLSALEGAGLYRRTGDDKFGEVLMAADTRAQAKTAWAALKAGPRTFANPLNG